MTAQEKRSLIIQISSNDCQAILTQNQKVTIVRSLSAPMEYSVVCAAFEPDPAFTPFTVQFNPNWKAMAFTKPLNAFEVLVAKEGACMDAQCGNNYVFDGIGFVGGPKNQLNMFGIENQRTSFTSLTAGIGQDILSPGSSVESNPVGVTEIPMNNTFYFDPVDNIKIFTATCMEDGILLPSSLLQEKKSVGRLPAGLMISRYLEIDLYYPATTIHYNGKLQLFEPGEL